MSRHGMLTPVQWDALRALRDAPCGVITSDEVGGTEGVRTLTLRALARQRLAVVVEGPQDGDGVELWRITLRGLVEVRARGERQEAWARSQQVIASVPGRRPVRSRKLTDEQARELRVLAPTVSRSALARRYGVSRATVRGILRGESYRGVG